MVKSYTTDRQSVLRTLQAGLRQLSALRQRARNIEADVEWAIRFHAGFYDRAEAATGLQLTGLQSLEVGHGQMPMAAAYMAAKGNEVHGIDLDVLPNGLTDVIGYFELIRTNGFSRAIKTAARELTGINRALRREFVRQMGLRQWPQLWLRQAAATALPYGNESFDFVFSFHVFEHIDDPETALAEIVRVLRPGGGLFLMFPHYAHANALHDIRAITGAAGAPQPWAHLIPDLRATVQQGAFVNTLRLDDWRELCLRHCPNARFDVTTLVSPSIRDSLTALRTANYLQEFSDDELLTDDLVVGWRKPDGSKQRPRSTHA